MRAVIEWAGWTVTASSGVTLSSDFMTGFCGETEEDHRHTVTLMETVQYDMAYMFAYSMRKVGVVTCRLVSILRVVFAPPPVEDPRLPSDGGRCS